jgi:hypothetical protein
MTTPIPRELPCASCSHPYHRFLPCECGCGPHPYLPGDYPCDRKDTAA